MLRLYIWPFDLKTTSVSCPVEDITWNTLHWTLAEAWPHDLVLYLHRACRTLLSLWDHESWPPILHGILPSSSILELQTTLHSLKNYKQLLNFGLFDGNTPGTSVWIWPRPLFGLICFQSILHSWQFMLCSNFSLLIRSNTAAVYTPWVKKAQHPTLAHNFVKCWQIFTISDQQPQQWVCNTLSIKDPTAHNKNRCFNTLSNLKSSKIALISTLINTSCSLYVVSV